MNKVPGAETLQRFTPKLRYELISCAFNGHEVIGTDVAVIRPEDKLVVREFDKLRWHRCLRCDSWLPLPKPKRPARDHLPDLKTITPPLRGKALRDRYVLRLIAIDRAFHVLILGLLAFAIFLFAIHRIVLHEDYVRVLNALQGANGGVSQNGELSKLQNIFTLSPARLYQLGFFITAYAVLEAIEMVGLWFAKRWAEYLTFVATLVFIPFEVIELMHKPTVFKILALVINIAIALYLLNAKRLFGLRGGVKAEQREREESSGWNAIRSASV